VRPEHVIAKEEIFGPVLGVMRMDTLDAAMAHINACPYGNAACIYTRNAKAARTFWGRVNVGMLGINVGIPAPAAFFSFTGWKASFFGDLHVQGSEGMAFYTQEKVVSTRWL
jgi:malonate-semialdehyde dehydrogenase (acetylating)/methylmalonate-semialdehyde dehydrogenase